MSQPLSARFHVHTILWMALGGLLPQPVLAHASAPAVLPVHGLRGERLDPMGPVAAADQVACTEALRAYLGQPDPENVSALTGFLSANPDSPYRMGVLASLGSIYFRTGRFSECIKAYEQAWAIGRGEPVASASATAGKAAGELALMYARLGRYESLAALLKEVEGRGFGGAGPNLIDDARLGFALMNESPGTSFRCGPLALSRILAGRPGVNAMPPAIRDAVSTREGMSLVETRDIARQVGLDGFRVAKRAPGAAVLTPAVVHWKVGHYAAIVGRETTGKFRIEDPTFANEVPIRISAATLDAEASGYFLVAAAELPAGWTAVDDAEAAKVYGKGTTGKKDPAGTHPESPKQGPNTKKASGGGVGGGNGPCKGMASWGVHTSVVSLNVIDTPLGYQPPVGHAVNLTMTYNSRESQEAVPQPVTDTGGRWLRNTVAYLSDDEGLGASVFPGTGSRNWYKWDAQTSTYTKDKRGYSQLEKTGLGAYRVTYADGSVEVYDFAAWTWNTFSREYFRTSIKDPSGNETRFEYERFNVQGVLGEWTRLKKIIDPIGGETVFEYSGNKLDPAKVTDPFGRSAYFEYDTDGRLTVIRDVAGIESRFAYQGITDLMASMTTPYGKTTFEYGEVGTTRWLQATHPNGDRERVEFRHYVEGMPNTVPHLPAGLLVTNDWYHARNALYWDRKAMKDGPGNVNAAHITHFLHTQDVNTSSDLIESEKSALEGRIFYNYRGQDNAWFVPPTPDTRISKIARVLDDGSTQLSQLEYNALGNLTKTVDPLGRTTEWVYAENNIDVLEIRQKTGEGSYDVLTTFTYNDQHKPLTVSDAAGNVTTFTYNGRGQMLTLTDAAGQVTTFGYDALGRRTSADGPLPGTGDKGTFGYDGAHRLTSITDGSGRTVTLQYDALDRLVKKTYPDGTFDQWTYQDMDVKSVTSRSGEKSEFKYNSLREMMEIADEHGRRTLLDWCRCGDLKSIIDPAGKLTSFTHDVQGRLTGRINADGTRLQRLFEPMSGRLSKLIDEQGRELTFTYHKDDSYASLAVGGTAPPAPAVSMGWDANYPRMTQITMGAETTTLSYVPATAGQKGIGKLAAVDGPAANDTLAYVYDQVGRVTGMSIDGVSRTFTLDAISRITQMTDSLGTTVLGHDGDSSRVILETLPNGQTTQRSYAPGSALRTVTGIVHRNAANEVLSQFAMAYNAESRISSLTRQIGAGTPLVDSPAYDAASRLLSYEKALPGGGAQVFSYTYDASDNRTRETIDGIARVESVDLMNELVSVQPASGGDRSYEWDAAGRLTAVVQGTRRSEISYNALGQRTRLLEKDGTTVLSDRRFLWAGLEIAEERSAAGAVIKRFFPHGFTTAAGKFFYTRDHLGSIREVTDESGAVRARYDYDPYGRRTKLSGDVDADFGFSGHFHHAESGLVLTFARAYDPNLGRWISRDPIGLGGGINAYCYVNNDPLNRIDPAGMMGRMAAYMNFDRSLDMAAHAAFDGASAAATNPQNIGSAVAIGVTVAALPAATTGAAVAGVAGIGLSGYNIAANTYGDVGGKFGIESELTGSVPVDTVRWAAGGAGKWPNAEKVAYGCDLLIQTALGKPMSPAVEASVAKAVAKASEEAGAGLFMAQGWDLFGPKEFPSPSNPTAAAMEGTWMIP